MFTSLFYSTPEVEAASVRQPPDWARKCGLSLCSVCLPVSPWALARQLLCQGFSRQENWTGLLCPPPGARLDRGQLLYFATIFKKLYEKFSKFFENGNQSILRKSKFVYCYRSGVYNTHLTLKRCTYLLQS